MGGLRCGFGKSDISPPPDGGGEMDLRILSFRDERAGRYGRVRDPLCARAAFFELAGDAACIISLDLIGDAVGVTARIRRRLNETLGLPAGRVMAACTHAHATPETIGLSGHPVHEAWIDRVVEGAVSAACEAMENRAPCRLSLGETALPGVAHNRAARWEAAKLQRLDTAARDRYRMLDDTLRAAALVRDDGTEAGVIFNFACHPVCVQARDFLSADWPGAALASIENQRPAMFLGAACGDADPVRMNGEEDLEWTGRAVAEKIETILADKDAMSEVEVSPIRAARKVLQLPRREIPDLARLEREARELEAKMAGGTGGELRERLFDVNEQLAVAAMPETLQGEVQIIALGPWRIVGVPGELTACLGDDIRRAIRRPSWIVGCANGYLGYLAARAAYDIGGYETTPARWSPLAPGAAETIRDAAVELAGRLDEGQSAKPR